MVRQASTGELDDVLPRGFRGVKGSKVKSKYNSGELDAVLGQGPDASYSNYLEKQQKQNKQRQQKAEDLKNAQPKKQEPPKPKEWYERGFEGLKKAFSLEGAKEVGKDVKEQLVDAPVEAVKNAIAQAQMGQRGAGDYRSKKLTDARNRFAEEDFKAGKITKEQRDKAVAENNKRLQKTQETTKKLEKEFGRKYNQDQGAIDATSSVTSLDGIPALTKGVFKIGGGIFNSAANRIAEHTLAKQSEKLFKGIDKSVEKAAVARTPTRIEVGGTALGNEKVGIRTPVKPGIRQESTTYKIGVRTPVKPGIRQESTTYSIQPRTPKKITQEEYTKQLNKLSSDYDRELKSIEEKPALTRQATADGLDKKYSEKISALNNSLEKGDLPKKTLITKMSRGVSGAEKTTGGAPKRVATKVESSISKAEPTTGGAPTEGVNVRSSLYKPEPKKLRVTQQEATQKLEKAGYTTEESKAILSDALSNKGLSMPGSPKKIGYNEQSVIESARNYDGENLPESSNLIPLKSVDADAPKGTSKLGKSVLNEGQQAKVISKTEAEAADLPQYNKANMKEQAQYANELIKNDPQAAIDIALGRKSPPEHILSQTVFNAVEAHAKAIGGEEGANLLRSLARSKQVGNLTKMGQEIRAAAERDPHSPVNLMNEVKLKRAERLKREGKSITKEQRKDAKEVKRATPKVKKEDWDSFVKGVTC